MEYVEQNFFQMENDIKNAAAKYIKVDPQEIVVTGSTTMGLTLLCNGLKLNHEDEIITTTHAQYSTHKSLDYAANKNGATIKKITLYKDAANTTVDEIVNAVTSTITEKTRVLALTWVHSCTGVKTPIRAITDAIKDLNKNRTEANRIYVCVDGVHGFGIEDSTMEDLGCDFFVAGTHK